MVSMRRRLGTACLSLALVWLWAWGDLGGATAATAPAVSTTEQKLTGTAPTPGGPSQTKGSAAPAAKARGDASGSRLTREGLVIDFSVTPLGRGPTGKTGPLEGDTAEVAFRITDAGTGRPVRSLYPGAWIDFAKTWKGKQAVGLPCKDRAALYFQGTVGMRPLVDLNAYFLLVMNRDANIAVIDPLVGITGITKLYTQITLKRPGADWVKTPDDKRLFVTMPEAGQVAVVDTDTFKVTGHVEAEPNPMRIAFQPDRQYLWVGNDAQKPGKSGVTVIDAGTLAVAAHIPTGAGHHEIAFSPDSRYAFVTNLGAGTVTVIDIRRLEKVKDVRIGRAPISLAFSRMSQALYVAEGASGTIAVVDGERHEIAARIATKPGLGPLRFTEDGRWGLVVNSRENVVYVIDASTNEVAHTIAVGARPYQLAFSRAFAYVRSLGTERVSMINLAELRKGRVPPVVSFPAGAKPPERAEDLVIADSIVEAPGEAAVLVANPGDDTVYYYMEGMNAPGGNFRNYGQKPRAVTVVDRGLREHEPGVYVGNMRIPSAGTYEVAFLLDSPEILHCFTFVARPNPSLTRKLPGLAVEYLIKERKVKAGETLRLRFRLTDPATRRPRMGLANVRVLHFWGPGMWRTVVPAREVADGVYEAALALRRPGAYYVHVLAPPAKDLPYLTLMAERAKPKAGK